MNEPEPWQRVHVATPLVRVGRGLIPLLFVFLFSFSPDSDGQGQIRVFEHAIVVLIAVVFGFLQWLATRWRIEDGTLRIEKGLLRRESLRFPLDQVQAIDTVRPGLARLIGLSELRLRMAGHNGTDGRLGFLKQEHAEQIRARLLALAHGVHEHAPAPPEQLLLRTRSDRLIYSMLMSLVWRIAFVVAVAIGLSYLVTASAAGAIFGACVPILFALALNLWRTFNGGFRLTVAEAPDGLRVSSGLIETVAETIPRGRIQGVRMNEPLIWRIFGWCRLEVSMAGEQRRKGENKSESKSRHVVLPVGSRKEALWLLKFLVPDAPDEQRSKPPKRARIKTLLSFHNLSWQRNETCAVTVHGRLERVTDWVPLAKVQSIRVLQGPIQRRLKLANVHLDTANDDLFAKLTDRDFVETQQVLGELVQKCRNSRMLLSRSSMP